jgi:hypothetical protein
MLRICLRMCQGVYSSNRLGTLSNHPQTTQAKSKLLGWPATSCNWIRLDYLLQGHEVRDDLFASIQANRWNFALNTLPAESQ